mmetsp:Transcript_2342/g.4847  ORF Transcript_2342/g.4847 Transcript_2342/m.4847 type:complete len:117 (-) Transcript_2342:1708-2058(-)
MSSQYGNNDEFNQAPPKGSAAAKKQQEATDFDEKLREMQEITDELDQQFVIGPQFLTAEKMLRYLRNEAECLEKSATVAELRAMLKDRDLKSSGNRADLLSRLYYAADYFDKDHRK